MVLIKKIKKKIKRKIKKRTAKKKMVKIAKVVWKKVVIVE